MRAVRRRTLTLALATLALAIGPGLGDPARADDASPSPTGDTPSIPAEAQKALDAHEAVGGALLGRTGRLYQPVAGVPAPPDYPAGGYVLADVDTGDVILAKSPHATSLPASTMKALTALAVIPQIGPNTPFTAAAEDANVDGTKVGLDPGVGYLAGHCFEALLMSSANDCAVALARMNGGLPKTTAQMTAIARSLGALDTAPKNTSGLDATGQVTSAYDLALIGRAAVRNADIAPYLVLKNANFPGGRTHQGEKRKVYQITSHNKLLFNYPGTLGVKNGYTVHARHTNIALVRRGAKAYVFAFVNGADNNWRDNAKVFDWAFAYGQKSTAVGRLVDPAAPAQNPVQGAAQGVANAGHAAQATAERAAEQLGVDPRILAAGAAGLVLVGGATALRLRAKRR